MSKLSSEELDLVVHEFVATQSNNTEFESNEERLAAVCLCIAGCVVYRLRAGQDDDDLREWAMIHREHITRYAEVNAELLLETATGFLQRHQQRHPWTN